MIQEIITYTIIGTFIGISQSAGIGGGPILNICLMVGFQYSAKKSMSITYIFLMGGALASILKNIKKKNPKTDGPLMDYNLIMITLPMAVAGSIAGTMFNHLISEFLITILFTILLGYLSYNTFNKLRSFSVVNSQEKKQKLIDTEMKIIGSPTPELNSELKQILQEQKKVFPVSKIKIIGLIFVYTVIVLLFRGGSTYDSIIGLESCQIGSYVLVVFHLLVGFLISKSIAIKKIHEETEMQRLGYIFQKESDKMSSQKMWSSILSGLGAGLIGGALGLGGAIILVPAWLNKGIDKNIASSSSGPLIFFSALVAFFLAFLGNMYSNVLSLIFYFVLAFTGSAVVKEIVNYIATRFKLESMIFILLLITMVSSLLVLLPFQVSNYYSDPQGFMQFGIFC